MGGENFIESILLFLLIALIGWILLGSVMSKNKAAIFSPIVFFCIYLLYYVVIPASTISVDFLTGRKITGAWILLLGSILMVLSILCGFGFKVKRNYFKNTLKIYEGNNTVKIAILLFATAFFFNGLFYGFSLSFIVAHQFEEAAGGGTEVGHTEMYLTYFISIFPAAITLLLSTRKRKLALGFIVVASIIYLIGGFRFRLLILFALLFTYFHLFPKVRRFRWELWLPLFFVFYIAMGIIESTRRYGAGLDMEAIQNLSEGNVQINKADESAMVYAFSTKAMEIYSKRRPLLFEPIATALLMPVPRVLFPWKPDGGYLKEANMAVFQTTDYGNAFLNITEAYLSFGWLGIILYGLVIGYISKVFWITYRRNPNSIAAVILLGTYNGFLYIVLSRGYLAQQFTFYVYYILLFCWLSRLFNFLIKKFKT
jgi:MFS family permease